MKIIDGKDAVLGRLAVYAAKEALKGEEIIVVNCNEIIISGNKKDIKEKLEEKRTKIGSGQRGPKHSRLNYMIVKRVIRGMLPNARRNGRGREAYKKIKCYNEIPREYESSEKIKFNEKKIKFIKMRDIVK
ncbi:MAG: 50S ribosomal protein L13 [Nanoarchaeota archaeon]